MHHKLHFCRCCTFHCQVQETAFFCFSWRSVLTSSVLNTFPPSFIGDECLNIVEMCISLETGVSEILKNLGLCLTLVEMQSNQAREVWVKVWPEIRKIANREAYLNCCQVWIEFVVKFFGVKFESVVYIKKLDMEVHYQLIMYFVKI